MLEQIWIVGAHPVQSYHHVAGHCGGGGAGPRGVGPGGVGPGRAGLGGGGQMDHNIVRLPHAQHLGEKDENFHRHELLTYLYQVLPGCQRYGKDPNGERNHKMPKHDAQFPIYCFSFGQKCLYLSLCTLITTLGEGREKCLNEKKVMFSSLIWEISQFSIDQQIQ